MTRVERNSGCKINLFLNILGKRPDGFHELETVMQPVDLQDTLTFERLPRRGVELTCNHPDLPTDSRNLAHRAALMFLEAVPISAGVRIHLEKRIPLAAGLGGGSANAAATLLGLSDLFERRLAQEELHRIASRLGSDVPFFLQDRPALATGRGEQITQLESFPALQGACVVLIHPGFGVSTGWAYQALANFPKALHGSPGRAQELISTLGTGALADLGPLLYNSLEAPVLQKYPVLRLYQEFFRDSGAAATLMSGSGSTTFALFDNDQTAKELLKLFVGRFGDACWTAVIPLR